MMQPKILGINRTQDGSISFFEGPRHVLSIHKERLSKRKHHWGRLGDISLYKSHIPEIEQPYDLIVECWSADAEREQKEEYHRELKDQLPLNGSTQIVEIPHHLAHLFSAWPTSGFDECAVMIIDSVGSPANLIDYDYPGKTTNPGMFEVASYYVCKSGQFTCIQKQLHDRNPENPNGLGNFYYLLTRCFFDGEGNEGKVMGLSSFGDPSKIDLPDLIVKEGAVFIPQEWQKAFETQDYFYTNDAKTFQEKADFAARGQEVFEIALVQIAEWLSEKTGMKNIAYAGGCALNCVANSKLLDKGLNVFIPPAPHDGGTSVGCAIYGVMQYYGMQNGFIWDLDYLGPEMNEMDLESELKEFPDLEVSQPEDLAETCATLLSKGKILCVHQPRSEFGPRALGNRSIVADTRYEVYKSFINTFVKGREWFRPIAPFVMEELVSEYFDFEGRSPFMLFTAFVREQYRGKFPAIEHVDQSARIQTVSEKDNKLIYDILVKFKEKTGVGIITNTSFNGKNETMVESVQDSLRCFNNHPIHHLVIPPFLISKKQEVLNPLQLSGVKLS